MRMMPSFVVSSDDIAISRRFYETTLLSNRTKLRPGRRNSESVRTDHGPSTCRIVCSFNEPRDGGPVSLVYEKLVITPDRVGSPV